MTAPSLAKKPASREVQLFTITLMNPNNQLRTAVLNIWFVGDDIVLGGLGWYEFFEYEKMQKEKEKQ